MTEKRLTKRMEALTNLAHYSTQITLKLPTKFLKHGVGEVDYDITKKLQNSLDCLLKDSRNDVNVLPDYWDKTQTVIDIKVICDDRE